MNASTDSLQAIAQVVTPREKHWVGDGFNVSTIFSPHIVDPQTLSPFVLLDHAAPRNFGSATRRRGVGEHPHRGFETVTFAYQGEVAHRDSHGGGGTIYSGDVQWMTAASGVVHEEFHSEKFTEAGGIFEMIQLWVNLPASDKMNTPRYQLLKGESFPRLDMGHAQARLIAGELLGKKGPAKTHTPITIFDLEFDAPGEVRFELPKGATTLLFMLQGDATAQEGRVIPSGAMAIFDRDSHGAIQLAATKGTRALILSGQPLNEPVVAHGPFVMNTKQEIAQAIKDYRQGKMGSLQPQESAS